MIGKIKYYAIWAVILGAFYFVLNNHFIFFGGVHKPYLLKKSKLNLKYTFYSCYDKKPEDILSIDDLRKVGIGNLLVEKGIMDEKSMRDMINKYDHGYGK